MLALEELQEKPLTHLVKRFQLSTRLKLIPILNHDHVRTKLHAARDVVICAAAFA